MDYQQHDAYLEDQVPVPVGNPDVHHSLSRQRQRQQDREQHSHHTHQSGGGSRVLQSPSISTIQHQHADPSTLLYTRPQQPQQQQTAQHHHPTAPLASTATKESYLREALLFYERGDFELAKNVLVDHVFQTTGQQHIPVHPMLFAESLLLLGNIHAAQGDMEACDRRYSECYEVIQDEYCGVHSNTKPKHIGLAIVLINHSTVLIRRWEALNHLSLSQVISHHSTASGGVPSRSSSAATAPLTRMDGAGSNNHVRVSTAPAASSVVSLGMLAAGLGLGVQDDTNSSSPMKLINEALSMLKSAHSIVENTLGADRLVLADCLHNMGCCHQIMGGASVEALECFMRSLKIRERVPEGGGGGDIEQDDSRSASNATNNNSRMEHMSRFQLTAMCVSSASTSSLKIAATLEHIAMVLFHLHTPEHPNTGRLKQSENIMKTVAVTRKRVLGPLSVGYAEALFNLATVESELGLKRNAHSNFRTCHAIRSKAFGDQHELTLLAQLMTMSTKVWKGAH